MRTIGGRYELCGVIASGGMATVHLARQVGAAGFARMVAVKQLHERFARAPEFVAMFLDEARLVARIRHVNVVQTLDVVHEKETGELFIVMEYVHGVPLHQVALVARTRGVPVPPAIAAAVMIDALHGLHEAHEARSETGEPLGIVHRDVSPHNILVGVDGAARVIDFGVAKAQERISSTHEGELKGKLSYMAPEQISLAEVDRRTDVYAASVVLWELLAGRKLFGGGNEGAVLKQVLEGSVSPPSLRQPLVPPGLDEIVMRGVARDMRERWPSARDLADALGAGLMRASSGEVSTWLRELCADMIAERQAAIALIEAKGSGDNQHALAESMRSMGLVGSSKVPSGPKSLPSSATIVSGAVVKPGDSLAPGEPPAPAVSAPPPPGRVSKRGTLLMPPDIASLVPTPRASATASAPPPEVTNTRTASVTPATPARAPSSGGGMGLAVGVGAVLVLGVVGTGLVFGSRYLGKRRTVPGGVPVASASSTASVAPAASAAVPTTCPAGMVLVQGGNFFMGTDDGLEAEKPSHHVKIHALCIDRHEVTANAYRACSDRGDCKRAPVTNRFEGIKDSDHKLYDPLCTGADTARGNHPINCIDWDMADRFCRAEGKRLPTEAEWEFAARGSDGRKYPWGDAAPGPTLLNACGRECEGWFRKNRQPSPGLLYASDDSWPTTAPVGSFPAGASRCGAEDMAGNVWEWVADWYGAYTAGDQSDPTGPAAGTSRVMRGGGWNGTSADWLRPAFRFQADPDNRTYGTGFRCAKTFP